MKFKNKAAPIVTRNFCNDCGCKMIELTLNVTHLKYDRETGMPYSAVSDFLVCSKYWSDHKIKVEEHAMDFRYPSFHDMYVIKDTRRTKEWPNLRKDDCP